MFRIMSARKNLRSSPLFTSTMKPISSDYCSSNTSTSVGNEIKTEINEDEGGNQTNAKLELMQDLICTFRECASPLMLENELKSSYFDESMHSSGQEKDDIESTKAYLMEQMSMALVQTSHWQTEWDALLDEERLNKEINSSSETPGAKASVLSEAKGGVAQNKSTNPNLNDIRHSDVLGVPHTPAVVAEALDEQSSDPFRRDANEKQGIMGQSNDEENEHSHSTSDKQREVVRGLQWRLTTGVLRAGEDVLAGSVVG